MDEGTRFLTQDTGVFRSAKKTNKILLIGTYLLVFAFGCVCAFVYIKALDNPGRKHRLFVKQCLEKEKCHISPLEKNAPLVIRNDMYGGGNFGAKRNGGRKHRGIDLKSKKGKGVFATKSGIVITSELEKKGMGHYIEIEHFDKTKTLYGHLSDRFVKKDDIVNQGQVIGSIGKTGNAYNKNMITHIHYELWIDGKPVDPMQYINKKE